VWTEPCRPEKRHRSSAITSGSRCAPDCLACLLAC
jgi:hypothetical protein